MGGETFEVEMMISGSKLGAATIASIVSGPALAGHLFTQNVNNTPTWVQEGQGIQIDQVSMEPTSANGSIAIYFEPNAVIPDSADTSDDTWWAWSAGDVLRFTVPTEGGGTQSTTIAYDANATCAYDICSGAYQDERTFNDVLPSLGTTSLAVGYGEASSTAPLVWIVEALEGEFSLAGYRIDFANGRPNGTGAGPLDQTSVVDSGELSPGGGTPDIDTSKEEFLLSDLEAGNVTNTFEGGTLTADAPATVASNFVINPAGGSIDTAGHAANFAGQFSGSGALTKTGEGTLLLSGDNSYSGGTTVTGGTLAVSSNANLGAPSGGLMLNGGGLVTMAGFNFSRPLAVQSGGGFLTNQAPNALVFTNPISGSGDLSLTGSFAISDAAHSHTGAITIAEGRLVLNGTLPSSIVVGSDSLLSGGGVVDGSLEVAGTLAPGSSPGTLTVGGDVTLLPTATVRFEIDGRIYDAAGGAGTYDRLVLTDDNAVFTADGTIAPVLRGIAGEANNDFVPVIGDSFRVITTANDEGIAGAFASVAQPNQGLAEGQRFAVLYGSDYINLVVAPTTFLAFAQTLDSENVIAAAEAIDAAVTSGDQDAEPLIAGLYGLDPSSLAVALEQSSGEIHAFALDAVRAGLAFSASSLGEAVAHRAGDEPFWIDASGTWNEASAGERASAHDSDSGHLWVGRDLYSSGGIRAGLAFGYSSQDVDTAFGASANAETYMLAGYATAERGGFLFDVMLAGARSNLDTTREVELSTGSLRADASGDVRSALFGFGASHRHQLGRNLHGRAWGRLVATASDADAYEESGADFADIEVGESWSGGAVTRFGYEIGGTFDVGTWHAGLGLEQTTGRVSRQLSQFGEDWRVSATERDVAGFASAGIALHPTPNSTFAVDIGVWDGDGWNGHSVGATYRMVW